MSVPKKRRSSIKVKKRRAGIHGKMKIISLNNIVMCRVCNKPRLSHKYCCENSREEPKKKPIQTVISESAQSQAG